MVAELLLQAVVLNGGWVLQTVLLPVIGIAGAPLARAVAAPFAVFGIGGDSFLVVVRAPPALAIRFFANRLATLELRWLEQLPAVAATPLTHRAVVASDACEEGGRDLETDLECLPRPRQWLKRATTRPGKMRAF